MGGEPLSINGSTHIGQAEAECGRQVIGRRTLPHSEERPRAWTELAYLKDMLDGIGGHAKRQQAHDTETCTKPLGLGQRWNSGEGVWKQEWRLSPELHAEEDGRAVRHGER
jgi:hypothetical protein